MVKRKIKKAGLYIVVTATAVIMGYPLLWLFFAAFKDNAEIFTSIALLPEKFTLEGFINGWKSTAAVPFSLFLLNSCKMVAPTVLLTAASACLVAYGFSRFEFAGRKVLFTVMLSTMMLPNTVIMIPRYILFNNFGWLNSYIPFYIMAAMAANPFFT